MSRHATVIRDGRVYFDYDGAVIGRDVPEDITSAGQLLRRVAARTGTREGVLLLDGQQAGRLGWVGEAEPAEPDGLAHAAELAVEGWQCRRVRSWTTVIHPDLPTLHVGVLPWMPVGTFGLRVPDGHDWWASATADALGLWWELTGSAYLMSPGVAALRVLQDMARQRRDDPKRRGVQVVWKWEGGPAGAVEDRWSMWTAPRLDPNGVTQRWRYDARRAGLAAFGNAEVCPWPLKHTGRRRFDPREAGWWLVEVPPWNHPHIPDPAGPGGPGPRWLTTPTVALLEYLASKGLSNGIGVAGILDSWTGKGMRLFREWAERMDRAFMLADGLDSEPGPTVAFAVKQGAGREAHGMLVSERGSVRRPDWYHTVTAVKRANMWRKLWTVYQKTGVAPVVVDDDCLTYTIDIDVYFPEGDRLGQWRYKHTK